MRILHVIYHLGQGGAQTYLFNLLRMQVADSDIEPSLLVLGTRGALSSAFDELLPVDYLEMRGGLDLIRAPRIVRYLKRCSPDLIHSHSNNLAFNFSLQIFSFPLVYTEHGGGLLGGRKRDQVIYRYLSRPFCRIIAISEEMMTVMSSANPLLRDRIVVVYNGVVADSIAAVERHDGSGLDGDLVKAGYKVGVVGRLEDQKGVDLFVRTAALIAEQTEDVVFMIIGDGTLRSSLEKQSEKLGIAENTFFLGYRTDAISLLKTFDVFLFTSDYEPFGLVIIEAMAAGVPVVALHKKGAVREIINHGVDGLIVEQTSPELLAEQVRRLLCDNDLRTDIIGHAKERVRKRFSMNENARNVKRVYQECLARPVESEYVR